MISKKYKYFIIVCLNIFIFPFRFVPPSAEIKVAKPSDSTRLTNSGP